MRSQYQMLPSIFFISLMSASSPYASSATKKPKTKSHTALENVLHRCWVAILFGEHAFLQLDLMIGPEDLHSTATGKSTHSSRRPDAPLSRASVPSALSLVYTKR